MSSSGADSRWGRLADELARRDSEGLRRRRRIVARQAEGRCEVAGRTLINAAANDYLGLAEDPRLAEAAAGAALAAGVGAGASPLVSGRTSWHAEAEAALARFEGAEAALLFPTGYAANMGTVSALVQPGDLVFCDRLNHACLVDGIRLSGARLRIYRHDALDDLRNDLAQQEPSPGGQRWIVTDGVFGMDGVLAPLRELCELAEEFGAELIVDEAHGTGVYGQRGRGACEEAGVEERVAVRVGTLSKALGCQGGFVTGPEVLIDGLWNTARMQMFSTAPAIPVCAAAKRAVDIVEQEPERRNRVRRYARTLRNSFRAEGLDVPGNDDCPIIPVILGAPSRAVEVGQRLEELGVLSGTIRPPTVPRGTARLRLSLSAAHSDQDIEEIARAVLKATCG